MEAHHCLLSCWIYPLRPAAAQGLPVHNYERVSSAGITTQMGLQSCVATAYLDFLIMGTCFQLICHGWMTVDHLAHRWCLWERVTFWLCAFFGCSYLFCCISSGCWWTIRVDFSRAQPAQYPFHPLFLFHVLKDTDYSTKQNRHLSPSVCWGRWHFLGVFFSSLSY